MLFESCDPVFGGVDLVIVGWDKVDVHMVVLDVCFNGLGEFVVHCIEPGCIPAGIEIGKNICQCCNHGTIVFGRHGTDKDGIQVINVCHKQIWHVAERLYGEDTGAISVHCPSV